ncbi:hypothetical protein [Streptomyces sp. NPDC051636]|uniref:hypothetical protein n=1 Tax=Streptomyces sp. NPDC051636 TaxID=3365663 RepID=UPI0037B1B9C2
MDVIGCDAVDVGTLAGSRRIGPNTPVHVPPYLGERPAGLSSIEERGRWFFQAPGIPVPADREGTGRLGRAGAGGRPRPGLRALSATPQSDWTWGRWFLDSRARAPRSQLGVSLLGLIHRLNRNFVIREIVCA